MRIHYLWTGSEEMKARQAGIASRTMRDRVFIAKYRLDDLERSSRPCLLVNNQMHKTREESITH